jgi:hypothetical protein
VNGHDLDGISCPRLQLSFALARFHFGELAYEPREVVEHMRSACFKSLGQLNELPQIRQALMTVEGSCLNRFIVGCGQDLPQQIYQRDAVPQVK